MGIRSIVSWIAALAILGSIVPVRAGRPNDRNIQTRQHTVDAYISSGDNHYLGSWLSVDSPAAIGSAFDMLKDVLHVRRIYWRGLQEMEISEFHSRPESFRYDAFLQWMKHLINDVKIEPMAARMAHDRGMEFWGVGTLCDWGCSADTPLNGSFPWPIESKLRLEHPEWIPVDRYGYRRQGGPICLAYPEARKALVELNTRLAVQGGYDGVIFLTYAENLSQRFQDEFGYNEPIVQAFKKRYGIDIRYQPFTKYADRSDWYKLRGEYVTQYLRELKQSLNAHGIKLGLFINPRVPHKPDDWQNLTYWTMGNIYFDLETWVQQGLVDELAVYGGSNPRTQAKTVDDLLWLTRGTDTKVSLTTSSPASAEWKPQLSRGVPTICALGKDEDYFLRGGFPAQTADVLKKGTQWQVMRFLSQMVAGQSKAPMAAVLPYTKSDNVLMCRLAVRALGATGDPKAVPVIEQMLFNSENGVRCAAMQALRDDNGPQSVTKILKALAAHSEFPLREMARDTLRSIRPAPLKQMIRGFDDPNPVVRTTIIRASRFMGLTNEDVPALVKKLDDPHRYVRYAAAMALGSVPNSPAAIQALIKAMQNKDVAVSDQAAAAIESIVRRNDPAARSQRAAMLDAVKALFEKMGDGCTREDAQWGYRPAGNALLAFGDEGTAFLNKVMRQNKDKRLAELAWRVSFFRMNGTVVSRQEDDAAFRMRPIWLKTRLVPRMKTDFESPGFIVSVRGYVGDANQQVGRWGPLTDKGPVIDDAQAYHGNRSLKLIRGGDRAVGRVVASVTDGNDYEVSFWLRRDGPDSAMTVSAMGQSPTVAEEWSMEVDPQGRLKLQEMDKQQWVDSGLVVAPRQWTQIRITVARSWRKYTAAIQPDNQEIQASSHWVPLTERKRVGRLDFAAAVSASPGSSVHVDDVAIQERP